PAAPAAPTWSEEPAVAAAQPPEDARGLEVVPRARPAAAGGLVVRAGRGRALARAERTSTRGHAQPVASPAHGQGHANGVARSSAGAPVERGTLGEARRQRELASPVAAPIARRDPSHPRPWPFLVGLALSTLVVVAAAAFTVTRKA